MQFQLADLRDERVEDLVHQLLWEQCLGWLDLEVSLANLHACDLARVVVEQNLA